MYSNIRLSDLLQWTGGKLIGPQDLNLPIRSISSDSRSIKKGEAFIALKGENFDGHAYLQKASEQGAILLISEKEISVSTPLLLVQDSLRAFVKIGQGMRDRFKGPVFAVTGSAGKSSTRDMIATLCGPNTLKAPASFNNLLGVSKTLCLLEDSHQKLILEMGMNHLFEIKEMCEAFRPTYGLITNIGTAHIGNLGSQENIFKAKKELFDYLTTSAGAEGIAVNHDDPLVQRAWNECSNKKIKTISYSANGKKADVRIEKFRMDPETCYLDLKFEVAGQRFEVAAGLFGLHHAENAAAGVAAALLLGETLEAIEERLKNIRPAEHRGVIHQLSKAVTLIDESYNSNPTALKSSLHSLSQVDAHRRRVLVIGEMRELGTFAENAHREVGQWILNDEKNLSGLIVTVGKDASLIAEEVSKLIPSERIFKTRDHHEALSIVREKQHQGDVIFVKGSHGIRLDLLVDALAQK